MPFKGLNTSLEAPGIDGAVVAASIVQVLVGAAVLVGSIYTLSRFVESVDETGDGIDGGHVDTDLEAMDPTAL